MDDDDLFTEPAFLDRDGSAAGLEEFGEIEFEAIGEGVPAVEAALARTMSSVRRKPMILPPPSNPFQVSRMLLDDWRHPDSAALRLRNWQGAWLWWSGDHWAQVAESDMRNQLWLRVGDASYWHLDAKRQKEKRPWAPTVRKISDLAAALASQVGIPANTAPGTWLDGREQDGALIPVRNGLLEVASRRLMEPDPLYFNLSALPFDYDPNAGTPEAWLSFLDSLWPDDPDSISALQEIAGYIVSGNRDLQRIVLLVGPTRSGKGTIAGVLRSLVGPDNCATPTLAGLATSFGLASLVGKPLAIVPDARMPREGVPQIVERLLMISGRDAVEVDRKYQTPWTGVLPTQFVIMSNELPTLPDAAAAITGRLLTLRMVVSFAGREDTGLAARLLTELPGILNWSLEGLDRLAARGRFAEPESSAEAAELLRQVASPISTFLAERCQMCPDCSVGKDILFAAWCDWCRGRGRDAAGVKETFSKALFAAAPQIKQFRPREDGQRAQHYQGVCLQW